MLKKKKKGQIHFLDCQFSPGEIDFTSNTLMNQKQICFPSTCILEVSRFDLCYLFGNTVTPSVCSSILQLHPLITQKSACDDYDIDDNDDGGKKSQIHTLQPKEMWDHNGVEHKLRIYKGHGNNKLGIAKQSLREGNNTQPNQFFRELPQGCTTIILVKFL